MAYPPHDPNSPQQPGYGQPSGYDQGGYPQYDQPYSAPPSTGAPYDPYAQQQGYGQPPGYQQPYAQQPYGYAQPARGTNTMAILSLVFAFVFAPVGIVLGHMAKKQIAQTGEDGDGLATAGLVCSYIFTGLWVLTCVCYGFGILAAISADTSSY
ncbi:DUF4190 domain-containing protein [Longispora albida]|uniref:DUF4190 domain-containing protein n=1 Tax=Longispora albida TaxID=203523 RepID=UPI0003792BDC|nr:DUF4190 domain-containing protein [Longispora albida]